MLNRRTVERKELVLLDAIESIGVENLQNILRLDSENLKEFHEYIGRYIERLQIEETDRKVSLEK
tara:strand:+ start:234 stop:428 length:195 start_codon:yes stop_codon:yes gene_type:complete